MESFIQTHHANFTPANLETLLKSLVRRVVVEQELVSGKNKNAGKKTLKLSNKEVTISKTKPVNNKLCTHRISKCWCVIRYIAEHPYFSAPESILIIEDTCKPLLKYIAEPQDIDFDDDIIFFITSLLTKRAKVSYDDGEITAD